VPDVGSGTTGHPFDQNAWLHYSWVSNELRTARILACPSDDRATIATDFSLSPSGLLHPGHRNRAISYILALHSVYSQPNSALCTDRNMRATSGGGACSSGIQNTITIIARPVTDPSVSWTNALHGTSGNVLRADGGVTQATSQDFRELLRTVNPGFSSDHFLYP
jgi:hypothetical protein